MTDDKYNKQQLAFWTAAPIRYGLPALIALMILGNIIVMQQYLFADKSYNWVVAAMLLSIVVDGVAVHRKVENLKRKVKK